MTTLTTALTLDELKTILEPSLVQTSEGWAIKGDVTPILTYWQKIGEIEADIPQETLFQKFYINKVSKKFAKYNLRRVYLKDKKAALEWLLKCWCIPSAFKCYQRGEGRPLYEYLKSNKTSLLEEEVQYQQTLKEVQLSLSEEARYEKYCAEKDYYHSGGAW
jgi:hypothetical protein